MIFHKKELCLTQSVKAREEVADILHRNDIAFDLTTIDRNAIGGGNGVVREGYKSSTLYKFQVKKSDYEQAVHLIAHVNLCA